MVSWPVGKGRGPLGIDIGSRSVKLLQLDAARQRFEDAARCDLPLAETDDPQQRDRQIVEAIRSARQRHDFRGCRAVVCLGAGSLFVQNLRVAPAEGDQLEQSVRFEAAGRLPFTSEEAEIRFFAADDVRQADTVRREVVLMACRRTDIQRLLEIADACRLVLDAIDVEPMAMLRCYARGYRRDEDRQRSMVLVNVGASSTMLLTARDGRAMFVKYLDVGGRNFDEAIARHLKMSLVDAAALRRHHGDRAPLDRDPEITRSIGESVRPVLERMTQELSLCLRYHSVTFRGQPLGQLILSGGEANGLLLEWLSQRLDIPCELGNPLRLLEKAPAAGRLGQWDIAAGAALHEKTD